jgi:hypothetical protein
MTKQLIMIMMFLLVSIASFGQASYIITADGMEAYVKKNGKNEFINEHFRPVTIFLSGSKVEILVDGGLETGQIIDMHNASDNKDELHLVTKQTSSGEPEEELVLLELSNGKFEVYYSWPKEKRVIKFKNPKLTEADTTETKQTPSSPTKNKSNTKTFNASII